MQGRQPPLLDRLARYVNEACAELKLRIPAERKACLGPLVLFVRQRFLAGNPAELVFICTHNSRRSQMAQVWAQTAAAQFGVAGVECYSGGTEATSFNPRAVGAMRRAGFAIDDPNGAENPVYTVRYAEGAEPLRCFSKVFDSPPNPVGGFAAVMTCAAADAGCPVVPGADNRISLPYDDPGEFDGSARERDAYDERCRQIAREMLYVFSLARR